MGSDGDATVLYGCEDGVGRVTLNRPQAMNAITTDLARELERAVRELAAEANVIVLRGAGGNFCVGGDYKHLTELRERGAAAMAGLFDAFGSACEAIAESPRAVVAAVEGNALAGGFELMQACDFALVIADARIGDHHANFGMVPGGGSSQRLARLVGRQRALALLLTGDSLTGEEAAAWGLAYRALPPEGFEREVEELARRLAAKDRDAQATVKALVRSGAERPLAEGLAREREAVVRHLERVGAMRGFG